MTLKKEIYEEITRELSKFRKVTAINSITPNYEGYLMQYILDEIYKALINEAFYLDGQDVVFRGSLLSEDFVSGFLDGKGFAILKKKIANALGVEETKYVAEFDDLIVRGTIRVYEMIVSQMLGENDNRIFTGMMEVDHYDEATGRIWLDTQGGKLYNPFRAGDYIMVQQYNGMPSEENDYYITKEYELIITAAGIGNTDEGEDRLDWVEFRNFSTSMEVANPKELIAKGDTLVRVDNESDPNRKGIIQVMSVGNDTPYLDVIYGLKTDPDNSLKGRLGNLQGIHHNLFGWLQGFGEYLINLYAVGDFRLRRTGDNIDAQIEMLKSNFATQYSSINYALTEEDNYLTNATFTELMEGWTRDDEAKFITQNGEAMLMNGNLYLDDGARAVNDILDGTPVLFLKHNTIRQANSLIRKPGTHKEYATAADGVTTAYKEVKDTLYISLSFIAETSGTLTIGFEGAGQEAGSLPSPIQKIITASTDTVTLEWSGTWDGKGDFILGYTGAMYVKRLAVTDRALDDFKVEMSTKILQTDSNIEITGQRIDRAEGMINEAGIQISALETRIFANESTVDNLGNRITAAEASITVNAQEIAQTVKKGDVISSINQSAEQIKISADKIQLAGNVNINNVFKVNDDGTIVFLGELEGVLRFSTSYEGEFSDAQLYCIPEDTAEKRYISMGSGTKHIGKVIRIFNDAPHGGLSHDVQCCSFPVNGGIITLTDKFTLGPQETIELTCLRLSAEKAGWKATNKMSYQNIYQTPVNGRYPLAYAMGKFVWQTGDQVTLMGYFYDGTYIGTKMFPSRQATGRYDISFEEGTLPTDYMVFLQARSGNSDRTTLNKATLYESTSTNIHVETSDDASRNDGSFDFVIYDITNWDFPTGLIKVTNPTV